ncbi:MAG: signal peptidase II [Spirochaetota bacterium]
MIDPLKLFIAFRNRWQYFAVALVLFGTDMASKIAVMKTLPLGIVKSIFPPFLVFVHIKNPGVVYGIMKNPPAFLKPYFVWIVIIMGIAASIFLVYLILSTDNKQRLSLISFMLILGGAFGNIGDRFISKEVTDFISIGLTDTIRFPYIFNLADTWITCGFVLLIIAVFILREGDKKKA